MKYLYIFILLLQINLNSYATISTNNDNIIINNNNSEYDIYFDGKLLFNIYKDTDDPAELRKSIEQLIVVINKLNDLFIAKEDELLNKEKEFLKKLEETKKILQEKNEQLGEQIITQQNIRDYKNIRFGVVGGYDLNTFEGYFYNNININMILLLGDKFIITSGFGVNFSPQRKTGVSLGFGLGYLF